jgi:hypothetical protein
MVTETEGQSYEEENDTDTGVEPDEDEGEGDDESEAAAEPEVDYKAKYEEIDRLNADKAKALRQSRMLTDRHKKEADQLRRELAELRAPKLDIPDPAEDPIGALEALKAAILERDKPKAIDPKEQHQARVTELQTMEAEYAAENPDYTEASTFFGQHLREELETKGYSGDELDTEYGAQLLKLVERAEKAGKHPGDVVMELARKNGFAKAKVDKGVEKVNTMKAAKAASASIGGAPSVGNRNLTVEYVNSLPMGPEKTAAREKLFAMAKREERRA